MTQPIHAFVTGAGTGIGKAIALALAMQGYALSVAGRRGKPLEEVASAIVASGGSATAHPDFDVTDRDCIESGLSNAIERYGEIGVLVNCAGEAPSASFDKTDSELWHRVLASNLTSVFQVTRASLSSLRRAGKARIINIASTAGLTGYPYVSAYCAAKHGVVGLTRSLAVELARTDITVNAVCPGFTDTPLIDAAIETISAKTKLSEGEARASLAKSNPQGRLVTPQEVANVVLWLASPDASAITGQAISVSGGEVMSG